MDAQPPRRERWIVAVLCALAALRVAVFSAGFPLFDNVDEKSHFDLVYRYSRFDPPRGLEPKKDEAVRILRSSATWEYLESPSKYPGGRTPPPAWTVPPAAVRLAQDQAVAEEARFTNAESGQPPLYYAAAGAWHRLGEALGFRGGRGAYWIRLLNAPLVGLLVWVAYLVAREVFASGRVATGVALVAAFVPQDAFYSIGNDSASPAISGLAFLALLGMAKGPPQGIGFHVLAGLAVAASMLTKLTNAPILVVAAAAAVVALARARREGELRHAARRIGVFAAAAALPLVAWAVRNLAFFGDFTGMAAKAARLGWTPKPPASWLDHPIFGPAGLASFLDRLISTFWRGEFYWHGEPLASRGADLFYVTSTLLLVSAGTAAAFGWGAKPGVPAPREGRLLVLSVAASVLMLVWGSIAYDFGNCMFPSRSFPYFASGRLMGGAFVPLLCLWVIGLERLLVSARAERLLIPLVGLVVVATVAVEILLSLGAFASRFNFFHMPGA